MSGKKSSEVAAVLRQGEKVRNMTNGIYRAQLDKYYKKYLEALEEEQALLARTGKINVEIDSAAEEMFGSEGKDCWQKYQRIKKKIAMDGHKEDRGKDLLHQGEAIDRESRMADKQAEEIRCNIMYKHDYCDREYRSAQRLVRTYENLGNRRKVLERQMIGLVDDESRHLSSVKSAVKQLENLAQSIRNMNETAKTKKEADALKDKLTAALKDIEESWANKFFTEEYKSLMENVQTLNKGSANDVIQGFSSVYGKIGAFSAKLSERVAQYKREKRNAENAMEALKKLADYALIEPIEYYNEGENGAKTDLFTYIKRYGQKDYSTPYNEKKSYAQELITQEDFTKAMDVLKEASDMVTKAREEGLELQKKMLSNTELAGDLQSVMEDLGYNTNLEIIDENPGAGYRLFCKVGDEEIDFTNLAIDDDGNPIINIDHKEGAGGSCANSWQKIAAHMREAGIPVTDVRLASGKSVLFSNAMQAQNIGSETEMIPSH